MKALKTILIVIALIIAALLLIAALMPKNYTVSETIVIERPADQIYSYVSDFKNWESFSPWSERDSTIKNTFEGESGVGSKMSWTSENSGMGSLTITDANPGESMSTDLIFTEPWESSSKGIWKFEDTEEGTEVTWGNTGDLKWPVEVLMFRAFGLKALANDFKEGLENLKEVVENMEPESNWKFGSMEVKDLEPVSIYSITDTVKISEMEEIMSTSFPMIMSYMGSNNETAADGPIPLAIYHVWDPEADMSVVECGVPVDNPSGPSENINISQTQGGKTLIASFYGPYEYLGEAHEACHSYMMENNLDFNGAPWEQYVSDPQTTENQKELLTVIYYPVKEQQM